MATGRISKTTLGLRFMQNARAKPESSTATGDATVKDDGEWQVSKEVRDAWGLGGSSTANQAVSYETSYIPFLYNSEGSNQPKGRRRFNQFGKEPEKDAPAAEAESAGAHPKDEVKVPKGKIKSISSATSRNQSSTSKERPKTAKSAREAIYDNSGVGIDLSKANIPSGFDSSADSKTTLKGFLKPADVPDPRANPRDRASSDSAPKDATSEIIIGARMKPKRAHSGSDQTEGTSNKRKKKTLEQSLR